MVRSREIESAGVPSLPAPFLFAPARSHLAIPATAVAEPRSSPSPRAGAPPGLSGIHGRDPLDELLDLWNRWMWLYYTMVEATR